jgi:HEAT repeat protein
MKSWHIHFAWAIVTALVAAVSARIAAPPEAGAPPRSAGPAAASPSSELLPGRAEDSKAAAPGDDLADVAAPQNSPSPKTDPPFADRIRALMKSPNAWEELQKLAVDVNQRAALLAALRNLLEDPDVQVQYYSLMMLKLIKGPECARWVEAYLIPRLNKEDGTAPNAIGALGDIGDPGSIPILRDALGSKSEDVRLACAQALQQLGDGGPASDLMAVMARQFDSPDGALRKKAIELIARFQPETGMPVFVRGLRDSNGDVRLQAVWALSNLGKREYLPLLQPLVSDPNPEVAKEAADAVESLKSQDQ